MTLGALAGSADKRRVGLLCFHGRSPVIDKKGADDQRGADDHANEN